MYLHYLKIALRNLQTRKQYAFMNIFNMMIGISCALTALIYVHYEFSYESWLPDADNIYRVEQTYHYPGTPEKGTSFVSGNVGPTISKYFSQIKSYTRLNTLRLLTLQSGQNTFLEDIALVDKNFIDFFSLTLVRGNKSTVLKDVNSILISESMAKKYFGSQPAIGSTITVSYDKDYLITGVFKDLPAKTHLALDFIALYHESVFEQFYPGDDFYRKWNVFITATYFKLHSGADVADINSRLKSYVNKYYVHSSPERTATTPSDYVTFSTREIKDIHLYSPHWEVKPSNAAKMALGFALLALLILIIAIINYASLATATSTLRAREIGLRKVMGATLNQIRAQFLGEAVITALFASFLALVLTELTLPHVAQFLNLDVSSLPPLTSPAILLATFSIGIISGLLAGLYPAFYLATIKPVKVLGANQSKEKATSWIRAVLLVLQFSVSIGLIVALTVVSQQIAYVNQADMGFDKQQLSVLRAYELDHQRLPLLMERLRALPEVTNVAASSGVPADNWARAVEVVLPTRQGEEALTGYFISVDAEFFPLYGLKPVVGRVLSNEYANDHIIKFPSGGTEVELNIVINKAALKLIGVQSVQQALGTQFYIRGENTASARVNVTVVGVIPDLNFGSAYNTIQPLFFLHEDYRVYNISIRSNTNDYAALQAKISMVAKEIAPDNSMPLEQMNELISNQYRVINRQSTLLFVLSGLAVLISCLGLFAMATFSVQRRTQEIGIRKVLGAGVSDIMQLFIFQFSKPVVIAMFIAWPISWLIMSQWLQSFVMRIDLSINYFLFAGGAALLISWFTVAGHVIRAARSKPIKALRHE